MSMGLLTKLRDEHWYNDTKLWTLFRAHCFRCSQYLIKIPCVLVPSHLDKAFHFFGDLLKSTGQMPCSPSVWVYVMLPVIRMRP